MIGTYCHIGTITSFFGNCQWLSELTMHCQRQVGSGNNANGNGYKPMIALMTMLWSSDNDCNAGDGISVWAMATVTDR